MRVDDKDLVEVRRGETVEVAQFLTTFQQHFCPESFSSPACSKPKSLLPAPGMLSPQDIENALEYRGLLRNIQELEGKRYIVLQYSKSLPFGSRRRVCVERQLARIDDQIELAQTQIEKRSEREALIDHFLVRFEVWSTKVLSQSLLIHASRHIETETEMRQPIPCCSSFFLNIPHAKHFQRTCDIATGGDPPIENVSSAFHKQRPSCCSLALPPNNHTWKAYARILQTVSVLNPQALKQAINSPCCVTNFHKVSKGTNPSLNHKFHFHGPDLVALWVRAQRNTHAMRHLWHLFEIQKSSTSDDDSERHWMVQGTGKKGTGKQLVAGTGDTHEDVGKIQTYNAILKGNPNYTRERLYIMTKLVDKLVEWTVVNQVLFTYRYVREYVQAASELRAKKRRRLRALFRPAKRARRSEAADQELDDSTQLKHACRSYLLRWFARRNREAVSGLFTSCQTKLKVDIGCDWISGGILKDTQVDKILQYLVNPEISNITAYRGDRTLSRIDRRQFMAERYDGEITVCSQVQTLLQALCESTSKSEQKLVKAAKVDFQEMYNHFFEEGEDSLHTARKLLETDSDSKKDLAASLKSSPLPWFDKCIVCNEGANDRIVRSCASCEAMCHADCSPSTVSQSDAIRKYSPLQDLCKLKQPNGVKAPDFRGDSDISWTSKTIIVARHVRIDGGIEPLGLRLCQTEECQALYDRLCSDTCLVSDLAEIVDAGRKSTRSIFPLAIDYKGCVIGEVFGKDKGNFCGESAGLVAGDVITSLEILSFADSKDASKWKCGTYTFSEFDGAQRLNVLKLKTTKLKLTIQRPSEKILRSSAAWYSSVQSTNQMLLDVFLDPSSETQSIAQLWFCENCLATSPHSQATDESALILQEALFCRAVIRRLGMESYAFQFFEERSTEASSEDSIAQREHFRFVSLRRLDSMMTYIMGQHSNEFEGTEDSSGLFGSFLIPPWAAESPCDRQRLKWAPKGIEERPMELLCRAMSNLLADGDASSAREKKLLARHFLSLFCSWCVGGTLRPSGLPSRGPPEVALITRAPWLRSSCSVCFVRPRSDSNGSRCSNPACSIVANSPGAVPDEAADADSIVMAESTDTYLNCSSLVGTTLLVLPNDPLVKAVSNVVTIDSDHRPVEFIVASYLPPVMVSDLQIVPHDDVLDRFKEGDGIYHLLPVVSARQLKFLLERCVMRSPPRDVGSGDRSWASLEVLNLDGVARFSSRELQKKLFQHVAIRRAIHRAVVLKAKEAAIPETDNGTVGGEAGSETGVQEHWDPDDSIPQYTYLIKNLQQRTATLFRSMLSFGTIGTQTSRELDSHGEGDGSLTTDLEMIAGEDMVTATRTGFPVINPLRSQSHLPEIVSTKVSDQFLVYSDLYFDSNEEKIYLESALKTQVLVHPQQVYRVADVQKFDKSSLRTCLLCRENVRGDTSKSSSSISYRGIGWGMEVVTWKHERGVWRIGRIVRNSPAFFAGLQTNDIIVSIDERQWSDMKIQADLVGALLGSGLRVRCPGIGDKVIRTVIATIKSAGVSLDPVVLVVFRPPREVHTRPTPSQNVHESSRLTGKDVQSRPNNEHRISATPQNDAEVVVVGVRQTDHSRSTSERSMGVSGLVATAASNDGNLTQKTSTNLTTNPRRPGAVNALRRQTVHADRRQDQASLGLPSRVERGWGYLYLFISRTLHTRPPVSSDHLYCSGLSGTVLSLVETAVFCEFVRQEKPILGMRLLVPRYDLDVVRKQVDILRRCPPERLMKVPVIPNATYALIMKLDYNRATNHLHPETGEAVFKEGDYSYRLPVDRLPLDRIVERTLMKAKQQQHGGAVNQPASLSYPSHTFQHGQNLGLHDAARGGYHQTNSIVQGRVRRPNDSYTDFSRNNSDRQSISRQSLDSGVSEAAGFNIFVAPEPIRAIQDSNGITINQNQILNPQVASPDEQSAPDPLVCFTAAESMSKPGFLTSSNSQGRNSLSAGQVAFQAATGQNGFQNMSESGQSYLANEAERIRGGGESLPVAPAVSNSDGTCLVDIPHGEWTDKPVYTTVRTSKNEGEFCSEATLIGFVVEPSIRLLKEDFPEKIEIQGYYLSNIGYFDKPRIFKLESDSLWVIDMDSNSEQARVIQRLRSKKPASGISRSDSNASQDSNVATRSRFMAMASLFVKRMTDLSILGTIPDGREVVWIRNDPRALYIRSFSDKRCQARAYSKFTARNQQLYADCLRRQTQHETDSAPKLRMSNPGMLCCLWGCSVPSGDGAGSREVLGFTSHKELDKHYDEHHSFGCDKDAVILGENGKFVRVQDGRSICDLSDALTSAICARRLYLIKEAVQKTLATKRTSSGVAFASSPIRSTLSLQIATFQGRLLKELKLRDHTCLILHIWSRIARLFEIEEGGLFRLSDRGFEDIFFNGRSASSLDDSSRAAIRSLEHISMATIIPGKELMNCSLCTLCSENVVEWQKAEENSAPTAGRLLRGVGCALWSDVLRLERFTPVVETEGISGHLAEAKTILFRVSSCIPNTLRSKKSFSTGLDSFGDFGRWDQEYFDTWASFVKEARNVRMLTQAFVALLFSIDRSKLPLWWRIEGGGWSTAQSLVADPTLADLILQLYVFDAAITEFISTSNRKAAMQAMSTADNLPKRMEKLRKLAHDLGFTSFVGDHQEYCLVCNDGGSLMCCELCPNVQHDSCCRPPITNSQELEFWICDVCIDDISLRSKHNLD